MAAQRDSQVRAEQSFRSRQTSTAARGHRERKFLSNSQCTFISFSTLGPPQLRLRLHVNLQHVSPSSSGTPWWDDEAQPDSQVEKSNTPRRELCDQVALSFFFFRLPNCLKCVQENLVVASVSLAKLSGGLVRGYYQHGSVYI